MTRKEFIAKSALLSMGLPFLSSSLLWSCEDKMPLLPNFSTNFSGKILIVGAGAAGISAAYMLKRYGIDFEIIEAAPEYGGRLKKASGFVDFPIDLGAEWIHTNPKILADILDNPQANADVDILVYNPQSVQSWNNNKLKSYNFISGFYSEWKFKNTTWFDFFEDYLVPDILDGLNLNCPVAEINYHGQQVTVKTKGGQTYTGDKVLITSSIKTLQQNQIKFSPALPAKKVEAIERVFMGDGIKIFMSFSERFYPDILAFGNIFEALNEEEKFVYDAAFRKDTTENVLGLFAINEKAAQYTNLGSEEAIIHSFLEELDQIFDGKASRYYQKHIIQNWSAEPYIQGAYSYSFEGNQNEIVEEIQRPVNDKIYFAGEALSIENQAMVHGACESAYGTVAKMLG